MKALYRFVWVKKMYLCDMKQNKNSTDIFTLALLEGINSKIQLAKKRARGFRNINNYINMIMFVSGKLKFDYPRYSL